MVPATIAEVVKMTGYVALLRAVNVGGTGKLPMTVLAEICKATGFSDVQTYIASGNVVFQSNNDEDRVRFALEDRLRVYAGKSMGVVVRTASEITGTLARNPFAGSPANRVMALFVDRPLPGDPLDGATGARNEQSTPGETRIVYLVSRRHGGYAASTTLHETRHGAKHEHGCQVGRNGKRADLIGQHVMELVVVPYLAGVMTMLIVAVSPDRPSVAGSGTTTTASDGAPLSIRPLCWSVNEPCLPSRTAVMTVSPAS